MSNETPEQIHQAFCDATSTTPNYRVHERAYADFISYGYTGDDLKRVIKHLIRSNNRMTGAAHSLRIDRLLDFEYRRFDALLNEAKAMDRNRRPAPTPKDKVIQLREHVINPDEAPVTDTSVPVKELLKRAVNDL